MKPTLYTTLLILLPIFCFGQNTFVQDGKLNGVFPIDENGKVTYQLIKSVEGASKDELFKRARKWFVKTYSSANQVLQINDQATGELTGKGFLRVSDTYFGATHIYPIRHLLSVEIRDNKYRIKLTDLVIDDRGGTYPVEEVPRMGPKWVTKFYTKINSEATTLVTSLETALNTVDEF